MTGARVPLPVLRAVVRGLVRPLYGPPVPLSVQRRVGDLLSAAPLPRGATGILVDLGGRPALRVVAPAAAACPDAVLWVHGGAFLACSTTTHRQFAAALSAVVAAPVLLLDYRLAPEHRHPAAADDVTAALAAVEADRVVLGGDSAGGALALLALQRPHRELAGLALVSPVVDLSLRSAAAWTGDDPLLRQTWLGDGVAAMFGMTPPDLLADLGDLPPTVVHVSEHERLRPEGEALAGRLGAELRLLPDVWHDVHLHAGLLREADVAVALLGASVRAFLAR